jgi:hypothetical protein
MHIANGNKIGAATRRLKERTEARACLSSESLCEASISVRSLRTAPLVAPAVPQRIGDPSLVSVL